MKKEEFLGYLNKLSNNKPNQYVFCFDKNLSFGSYIQDKIFIESLKLPKSKINFENEEFIY